MVLTSSILFVHKINAWIETFNSVAAATALQVSLLLRSDNDCCACHTSCLGKNFRWSVSLGREDPVPAMDRAGIGFGS
jgi:hypothetical protein